MSILKNVQTFIEYSEFFSEQNINIRKNKYGKYAY